MDPLKDFLKYLDPDPDRAGARYEAIRGKLILLFEARRRPSPPDLADEAINRVARRIAEGLEINDLDRYFYGVAKKLVLESMREPDPGPDAPGPIEDPAKIQIAQAERQEHEQRLRCLEQCLKTLTPETRRLIRYFYRGEKRTKIDFRKRLAAELGITGGALRVRARRIRKILEDCVAECLQKLGPQ